MSSDAVLFCCKMEDADGCAVRRGADPGGLKSFVAKHAA